MSFGTYPRNTVAAEISKYMGNAVKLADIWGDIIINVKAAPYLAKGDWDGTTGTDDTAAIQAAIDYAYSEGGGTVFIPPGRFKTTSTLIVKSNVTVIGAGVVSEIVAIGCEGFKTTSSILAYAVTPALTVQANSGDKVLTVGQTTFVNLGDIVTLLNNKTYDFNNPNIEGDEGQQKEFFHVVAKTSTTITLNRPVNWVYIVGTAVNNFARAENISLKNFKITMNSANEAVTFSSAYKVVIDGLFVDGGFISEGTHFSSSVLDGVIKNCNIKNTGGSTAIQVLYWSSNIKILDNTVEIHDRDSTGDGCIILYFGVNNSEVEGNTVDNLLQSGKEIHGIIIHTKSYSNTVVGNNVRGCAYGISSIFGSFTNTITGNAINSCDRGIGALDTRELTISSNIIRNCGSASNNTTAGVYIARSFDITSVGNELSAGRQRGFYVTGTTASERLTFSGNTIINHGHGIHFDATSPLDVIIKGNSIYKCTDGIHIYPSLNRAIIVNNIIRNSTAYGIYANQVTNSRMVGNTIVSGASDGIRLRSNAFANVIHNNQITSNTGYGIYCEDVVSSLNNIRDNTLMSNTGGRIFGAKTAKPTESTLLDTNFIVYNEPADPTALRTILGWRRKDATTVGTTGWITINVTEA